MELERIHKFLKSKRIAVVGVSNNKNKTGSTVFNELKKQGFNVVPVHPGMNIFENEKCYNSIVDLPEDVDALIIATKPEVTIQVLQHALDKNIRNIWFQLGSSNDEVVKMAKENKLNYFHKRCIFMFANPTGIHKFHAVLSKVFRSYPN